MSTVETCTRPLKGWRHKVEPEVASTATTTDRRRLRSTWAVTSIWGGKWMWTWLMVGTAAGADSLPAASVAVTRKRFSLTKSSGTLKRKAVLPGVRCTDAATESLPLTWPLPSRSRQRRTKLPASAVPVIRKVGASVQTGAAGLMMTGAAGEIESSVMGGAAAGVDWLLPASVAVTWNRLTAFGARLTVTAK